MRRAAVFLEVVSLALAMNQARAQTRIKPDQLKWAQINRGVCGGAVAPGTALALDQVEKPSALLDACWPDDLAAAAWAVIQTRCISCHGVTGPPPDTLLTFDSIRGEVGNLDLRSYSAMLQGGNRGPAVKPYDLLGSLVYRFASRFQLGAGPGGNTAIAPVVAAQTMDTAQGWGFRVVGPDSSEDSLAMPPWSPLPDAELESIRVWVAIGAPAPAF